MLVDLLRAEEVPPEFREPGILSGYRPCPSSLRHCLFSLFQRSNETVNFWTHFLPALFFFRKAFTTYLSLKVHEDDGPFVAYVLSVAIFLLTSSLAHGFWPISRHGRDLCFFLDYAALNFYSFGTAAGFWAYFYSPKFYSSPVGRYYVPICIFLCPLCTAIACTSRFLPEHRARKFSRLCGFAISYLWTMVPLVHDLVNSNRIDALAKEVVHIACLASGVGIYTLHWPERWFPGRFDVVGHSHNLLHVFGSMAAFVQFSTLNAQKNSRSAVEGLRSAECLAFAKKLAIFMPFICLLDAIILGICMRFKTCLSDDAMLDDQDTSDDSERGSHVKNE